MGGCGLEERNEEAAAGRLLETLGHFSGSPSLPPSLQAAALAWGSASGRKERALRFGPFVLGGVPPFFLVLPSAFE